MTTYKKTFGSGNIWTITIGLALFLWGLFSLLDNIFWNRGFTGTPWLLLPGGIMIISGISNIFAYRYNRQKVLNALESYNSVSMKQLAKELNMREKDVKETIVDLRSEGQLKASFEPESGDVIVLSVRGKAPIGYTATTTQITSTTEEEIPSMKTSKTEGFCQYCGSMVKPGDRFCNNCGSALEL